MVLMLRLQLPLFNYKTLMQQNTDTDFQHNYPENICEETLTARVNSHVFLSKMNEQGEYSLQ